jgi:hypothetical protein
MLLALAPLARRTLGDVQSYVQADAVLPAVLQWFVARGYERTARPDSAIYYYDLIVSPRVGESHGNERMRATVYAFAHQRLAVLYSRLGRVADAERHGMAFREIFTNPDPPLAPLVSEVDDAITRSRTR